MAAEIRPWRCQRSRASNQLPYAHSWWLDICHPCLLPNYFRGVHCLGSPGSSSSSHCGWYQCRTDNPVIPHLATQLLQHTSIDHQDITQHVPPSYKLGEGEGRLSYAESASSAAASSAAALRSAASCSGCMAASRWPYLRL